ncbi:polysaccharide pyruvyl transferase family protein [Siccirubricoccus phaeus]|uniref:polysaccharide pyruvyl transferase family protein n=1 Tax=Siccirubricoccus phaeus TaxID=2595053 RepID=UPI00165B97CA|nr:polysaccharide pyruvyl transferase family protein [Siccirubricoccus phaeus]
MLDHEPMSAGTIFERVGGNTGNLAFRYGVARSLSGPALLYLGNSPSAIRNAGDIVVLPLANQLGRHMKLGPAAERLRAIDLPVLGLGLGAQADSYEQDIVLDAGTRAWLEELASRAPTAHPNIGLRGDYTRAQVAKLGLGNAVTVTGCPSNFISGDPALATKLAAGFRRRPRRIAVAAGIPHVAQLAAIEHDLADIVTLTDGAYIVQHGIEMIELACREFDSMTPERLELCRNYIAPLSTTEEFRTWCSRYAYAFADVRQWMDFLRRFDFVVGTRFHGAMLAIQAGVPAACIAHDSRTLEMCQTMQIPVCHYKDINGPLTRHNVMDYFRFDAEAYTETRRRLCASYVGVLQAADLEVSANVLRLIQ